MRMPFGLSNAGKTFQRLMDHILRGLPFAFVYVDDILVASRNQLDTSDRPFNYWRRMVWWLTRTSASSERQLSISWATQSARTASPPLQTESTASCGYGSPLPPRRFRSSWEPSTSTTDLFPMHLRSYAPYMMFSRAVLGSSYGDVSRTLLSRLPNKHHATCSPEWEGGYGSYMRRFRHRRGCQPRSVDRW